MFPSLGWCMRTERVAHGGGGGIVFMFWLMLSMMLCNQGVTPYVSLCTIL